MNITTLLASPLLVIVPATVLNAFFHFRTPEGWARFCVESPRLSLVVMVSGRIGVDIAGLIRDVRDYTRPFRQRGWQFGGGDAVEPPPAPLVLTSSVEVFLAVAERRITPEQGGEALAKLRAGQPGWPLPKTDPLAIPPPLVEKDPS